jgi:hypothetical protein
MDIAIILGLRSQQIQLPGALVDAPGHDEMTRKVATMLSLALSGIASASIPYNTLPGGGKLPLLVMGDGVGWGRGTNCAHDRMTAQTDGCTATAALPISLAWRPPPSAPGACVCAQGRSGQTWWVPALG